MYNKKGMRYVSSFFILNFENYALLVALGACVLFSVLSFNLNLTCANLQYIDGAINVNYMHKYNLQGKLLLTRPTKK